MAEKMFVVMYNNGHLLVPVCGLQDSCFLDCSQYLPVTTERRWPNEIKFSSQEKILVMCQCLQSVACMFLLFGQNCYIVLSGTLIF